ncbi:12671_t:CDS:10 [Funneliformis geosporum]|uniref:6947_t:CDS:1 n=1 Tax=Funneliformis geosporum TaxID=1117311 RepID=A0A9W4SZY4_9GLOM|nr:6947_t:CDS:10 [Funneliformis geosporum]CAI2187168.1 12671_t:CDS:10 [Funneliformis geosporum]
MSTNATNVNEDRKRLKELLSDASELLKKQEQQKKRVKNPENTADLDDETEFLRNSLKDVCEDILFIDLKIANEHNIEEKLWRNVFYSHIEELRQKLRKIKPEKAEYQITYLELCRYLDLGTGFYHTIVNSLKIRENIDLDWIGIEIFKNNVNSLSTATRSASKYRRRELTAECIQRCLIHLGDFARYRETSLDANEKRWEFARHFYTKAARVYCENGKAQAQLALLAMYDDNELDVVYWYCFSLSTKQPSGISLENLKVFYSKFAQKVLQINENTNEILTVQDFVKKFMIIHWYIFEENVETLIKNGGIEEIFHYFGSFLSSTEVNLRNLSIILKKVVFILMFTIWDLRKGLDRIVEVRNLQAMAIGLVFGLLVPVVESIYSFLSSEEIELGCIGSVIDLFLPTVVLWCEYLRTLTDLLSQLYDYSKSIDKENQKIFGMFLMNSKNFFKSLINILNHQKLSDLLSANDDFYEIAKLALSEDREFLGVVPLRVVHQDIIFNFSGNVDVLKVSFARLMVFSKKISEIKSLALLEYNESSGLFIIIDEELKKKERQRVMKLMAHRFLQDQVDSLEDKVKNIKPLQTSSTGSPVSSKSLKHCVVDISVFLNHLNSVKKWVAEEKCIVIVPLDVIDSLDTIKKGNNKENVRARDAIRFLDEQLDQQFSKAKQNESELFIRAQKTNEKLPQWNCAENYIIKDGIFNDISRGIVHKDQKNIKESSKNSDDIYIPEDKFDIMDVPQEYRPAISCWLYYAYIVKMDEILFVSEDQYLKKYAKLFGISVVGVGFI